MNVIKMLLRCDNQVDDILLALPSVPIVGDIVRVESGDRTFEVKRTIFTQKAHTYDIVLEVREL